MARAMATRRSRPRGDAPAEGGPLRLTPGQQRALEDLERLWRRLALHLLRSGKLERPWAVGVTSALPGEGRTTTAVGLALALAQEGGEPVALVEAGPGRGCLAGDFGVQETPGLREHLSGEAPLEAALRPTGVANLTLLPLGGERDGAGGGAPSVPLWRGLPGVLEPLRRRFAYTLLDLGPLVTEAGAAGAARAAAGAVRVVRSGWAPLAKVREAAGLLEGRLLGVVHVGAPSAVPRWLSHLLTE